MTQQVAMALLEHLERAMNDHDLESLVSCFHPDYESIQPVHPERAFQGRVHVARNWGWVFEEFSDFQAEILDFAVRDTTVWTEWTWQGTDPLGVEIQVRGIMILTIEDQLFRVGRLYMEPVQ
jgi:hypothetical protein